MTAKIQNSMSEIFIKNLGEAEFRRDARAIASLFGENAELQNLTSPSPHAHAHPTQALSFWGQYLAAFEKIESTFSNVIDDGEHAVLEWQSKGRLANGVSIEYRGVSVLEYRDEKIQKFRTYYDSAALIGHVSASRKSYSESVGVPELSLDAGS